MSSPSSAEPVPSPLRAAALRRVVYPPVRKPRPVSLDKASAQVREDDQAAGRALAPFTV